ncbi:MAG: calcineurin-like phosphoesterase C-terminal domain-containing protein [Alistipes sp.]|nr:calcineurin-like phosphoesterase C-terminal domain-containing protein [Alistipes sp.]
MLGKLKFYLLTATLLCGVACSNPEPESGNNGNQGTGGGNQGTEEEVVINGTTIEKGNTVFGLISDSVTGKGIEGVAVTDGTVVVLTDSNGVYQIPTNRWAKYVWFSAPAEYEIPTDPNNGRPIFYSTNKLLSSGKNRNDWQLKPLPAIEEEFTLIAIGDPQCEVEKEANRFRDETLVDIRSTISSAQTQENRYHNAYAITLGDITFDNVVLWPTMAKLCSSVTLNNGKSIPIFNCIGNHDHDADRQNDREATELYIENVGPTDYSFNRGKAHIVVMDNIICTSVSGFGDSKTWNYDGGYTSKQVEWLEKDLDAVADKENKMVILCGHIPFRSGSSSGGSNINKDKGYSDVLTLLTQFKEAHIFIGHTHYPENFLHSSYITKGGQPVFEHVHGAACGGWWTSNICVDGTPNGYSIYQVKGATLHNWVAKSIGKNESFQMRVYNGNDTYGHKYLYTWINGGTGGSAKIKTAGRADLENCFVATIWNDDATNWDVELVVDGVSHKMQRVNKNLADMCSTAFFFNEKGKNTTSWNKGLRHIWFIKAPCGDPALEKNWEIRATHTVKGSGEKNVYIENGFTTSYDGF